MKNCLVITELFNATLHGVDSSSDPHIHGHYLVMERVDPQNQEYIDDVMYMHRLKYDVYRRSHYARQFQHPVVRHYRAEARLEIAECMFLSGGEYVAIIKTCWLRIFQRRWKRLFYLRRQRRKQVGSLFHKEICGTWPAGLR